MKQKTCVLAALLCGVGVGLALSRGGPSGEQPAAPSQQSSDSERAGAPREPHLMLGGDAAAKIDDLNAQVRRLTTENSQLRETLAGQTAKQPHKKPPVPPLLSYSDALDTLPREFSAEKRTVAASGMIYPLFQHVRPSLSTKQREQIDAYLRGGGGIELLRMLDLRHGPLDGVFRLPPADMREVQVNLIQAQSNAKLYVEWEVLTPGQRKSHKGD